MTKEELIVKLEENIEKVYFYCVKRCNNRMDAEDLSQTILLEILQNINKGVKINNFDYYIWAICKNQYNRYLKQIVHTREMLDFVEEIDEPGTNINALDELVYNENITRMNTVIKLLSKDYSEILYAYYVEDKKLLYIAEELKLPLGTVKRKLAEIRKKLKGYLEMEKLNGKKAYVPKEFYGVMGGASKFDPHEFTKPLMIKNLLFHSFRNPCSIEDYSIELGISRPYVEDYVTQLMEKEFLIKLESGKYLTNIAFIDKNLRKEIYEYVRNNINPFTDEIIKFCQKILPEYRRLLVDPYIDDEHLMWSLMGIVITNIELLSTNVKYLKNYMSEECITNWDYAMMEYLDKVEPDEFFISYNSNEGTKDDIKMIWMPSSIVVDSNEVSKIISWKRDKGLHDVATLANTIKLKDIMYSKLDKENQSKLDQFINNKYIKVVNDKVVFQTPCITTENYEKLLDLITTSLEAQAILKQIFDEIRNKISVNLTPNLFSSIDFILRACVLLRSKVLTAAYNKGLLKDQEGEFFPYNKLIVI